MLGVADKTVVGRDNGAIWKACDVHPESNTTREEKANNESFIFDVLRAMVRLLECFGVEEQGTINEMIYDDTGLGVLLCLCLPRSSSAAVSPAVGLSCSLFCSC